MHTKITAIIQARLGSTRLPGKTLVEVNGRSLLGHLVRRLAVSKCVDEIVIATTTHKRDDAIVKFAKDNNITFYRGSEEDVLDRFYKTCLEFNVETVVRVTPDCPILDPQVVDIVISKYMEGNYDYVSNTIMPTFPDGLDTEIFSFRALERAWDEATLPSEREHVTAYIVKHPEKFRLFNVKKEGEDLSYLRWTVDTEKDLEFVKQIFLNYQGKEEIFCMKEVIEILNMLPNIAKINAGITRNEGYLKSLQKDKEHPVKAKK